MSLRSMIDVFDLSAAPTAPMMVLMLALADNADDDHRWAWPSVATLARKTRQDTRTVQRNLRKLVELGEISVVDRHRSGTVVYEVHPGRGGVKSEGWQSAAPGIAPPLAESPGGVALDTSRGGTAPPERSRTVQEPLRAHARNHEPTETARRVRGKNAGKRGTLEPRPPAVPTSAATRAYLDSAPDLADPAVREAAAAAIRQSLAEAATRHPGKPDDKVKL